jgi:thymidylate synthase
MINIICPNAESALISGLRAIKEQGNEIRTRGTQTLEVLHASFLIEDPTDINILNPARKFKTSYAMAEWLWYLSHDPRVNNIGKLASTWNRIADENGVVESNYGVYLRTQWAWVLKDLYDDPESRRATFVINQVHHKGANTQDYPCTHYVQFFIRDSKLHMSVNMRSNDAVYGFCNDVFTFALFQQLMLNDLNLRGKDYKLGHYYHHAGSFHVYDHHYAMMDAILANVVDETAHATDDRQKFILNPEWNWNRINLEKAYLPIEDLTKNEINDFIALSKEKFLL